MAPSKINLDKLHLWLQIRKLSLEVMTEEQVEKLAGEVGKVSKPEGEDDLEKMRFAKVTVAIDVKRPLVRGFLQRKTRQPIWIEFKYERLPTFCNSCGMN